MCLCHAQATADVTVTGLTGAAAFIAIGTANAPTLATQIPTTRAFGPKLPAVVDVSAAAPPRTKHSYAVVITGGGQPEGLRARGMLTDGTETPQPLPLGYGHGRLPKLRHPANEISQIRLADASCRMSNGPSPDALVWLWVRRGPRPTSSKTLGR